MNQIPLGREEASHGRLGFLPGQPEATADVRPYEPEITTEALKASAKTIRIISEDIDASTDSNFVNAKKLMQTADQIIFMGFGYNHRNMERLELAKLPTNKARGSIRDISSPERGRIIADCNNRISLIENDCTHMIRERIEWS